MFSVLTYWFPTERRVWEWNTDSEWVHDDVTQIIFWDLESHYQINHNEQTHSEIRSSWNDLSSPSGMKRINEKLIDIDLIVDIGLKPDFRPENSWFGGEILKSSVPLKSHPQYYSMYCSTLLVRKLGVQAHIYYIL